MSYAELGEIAEISISNVDKKSQDTEQAVRLCNFIDVYNNWEITEETCKTLMEATANESEISNFKLEKGMLAITKDSETREDIGISTYISDLSENVVLGYHTALIIPDNSKVDSKYLNAYLKSKISRKYFSNSASGSGQRYTLTLDVIKKLPVSLPTLEEQKQSGELISQLNQIIENNNKINAVLESLAKTIYDYWFLQFEFPNKEGKPYKSSGGKMVWNEELKREIPEGWQIHSIDEFGDLSNGINYDKNTEGDKKYSIVNIRDMSASTLLLSKDDMDEISLPNHSADRYLINKDDILIARSGIPGSVRIMNNKDIDNTIYCGFIIRLSLRQPLYREYLVYKLKDYENTNATTSGGTILQNVSQDTLKLIKFVMPDNNSVICNFNNIIDPIWETMYQKLKENQLLSSLRDFLLPLLMNGQVGF